MIVNSADRINVVEEYYFSQKLKEIAAMEKSGIPVINLGIGKPDLPPAASIINALRDDSLDPDAHGYQSYRGIDALRNAMSTFYKRHFAVECDAESEILPLMGSKEGIMHISMAFLNPGDEVLIPNPAYPAYAAAANLAGAKLVYYNLSEENQYQIDLEELNQLVTSKTKLIWINFPHMPTGANANPENLEKLVFWARAQKILIASDAPYSFILNEEKFSILSFPGAKEICVELNSLSKSHGMSGWRIGMAISSKEIINAILRFKSNMDSGMFRPIQHASIVAMNMDDLWYKTNNQIYSKRRVQIWNFLDKINFSYHKDSAGLFVWSKISDAFKNGEEASDFFLKKCHVFAPPGIIFGSNGQNYVRWSLCQDIQVIEEAGRQIVSVMNY